MASYKKTAKTILPVLLLLAPMLVLANATEPNQQVPADAIWIEPRSTRIDITQTPVGAKFNITVWANCSVQCGGWEIWLLYPVTHLSAIRAGYTGSDGSKSDFFQNISTVSVSPVFGSYNSTHNKTQYGESWNAIGELRDPGYGSLCWIEFNITSIPATATNATLGFYAFEGTTRRTYLITTGGQKVDLTAHPATIEFFEPLTYTLTITTTPGGTTNPLPGSYFFGEGETATVEALADSGFLLDHWKLEGINVGKANPLSISMYSSRVLQAVFALDVPETRIFIDPSEIVGPAPTINPHFSINVTIEKFEDLKACMFNVSYDPDVIGWIGFRIYEIEDAYPNITLEVNDELGFIWMELAYQNGFTSTDPIDIVRLDCHLADVGSTVIDLHDSLLLDSEGAEINHTEGDGLFTLLIRDVAITDVTLSRHWTYVGGRIDIAVHVKNKGNVSEDVALQVYCNENVIAELLTAGLEPSDERSFLVQWHTQNMTAHMNYTLWAQAAPVPFEYEEGDNVFIAGDVEVRILGDVDGDGYVGIDDVHTVAAAFGSTPTHPRWNEYADLNQNNYVGIDDLYSVAQHFGQEA